MTSLHDRLDSWPEPWKPNAGDKLVGTVAAVEVRDGGYGEYPIVTVVGDDGVEHAFHGFHTVAQRELARQRPEPGDTIGVAYHGRDEAKGYERYRVIVERAATDDGGPDWDTIGAQADAELGDEEPPADEAPVVETAAEPAVAAGSVPPPEEPPDEELPF